MAGSVVGRQAILPTTRGSLVRNRWWSFNILNSFKKIINTLEAGWMLCECIIANRSHKTSSEQLINEEHKYCFEGNETFSNFPLQECVFNIDFLGNIDKMKRHLFCHRITAGETGRWSIEGLLPPVIQMTYQLILTSTHLTPPRWKWLQYFQISRIRDHSYFVFNTSLYILYILVDLVGDC